MKKTIKTVAVLIFASVYFFCIALPTSASSHTIVNELSDLSYTVTDIRTDRIVKLNDTLLRSVDQSDLLIKLGENQFIFTENVLHMASPTDMKMNEDTSDYNEHDLQFDIVQPYGFSDVRITALGVANGFREPLPPNQAVEYSYQIKNDSPTSASGISMEIWVDHEYAGTFQFGDFPAYSQLDGTFFMTLENPHYEQTIILKLNNGSQRSRVFRYDVGSGCELVASRIYTTASMPVAMPGTTRFNVEIINYGPESITNAYYTVYLDDYTYLTQVSFDLGAGYMLQGSFAIPFEEGTGVKSPAKVSITVSHPKDKNKDNNTCSTWVNGKSTPHWGGRWSNASSLIVKIDYDNFLNQAYQDRNSMNRYVTLWNNISSNVNLVPADINASESADITITLGSLFGPAVLGRAYMYGNGNEILNPYEHFGYYSKCDIVISNSTDNLNKSLTHRVIPHEVGHALGLAHIFEDVRTIMYPHADTALVSYPTVDVDYVNLRNKYGQ